MDDSTTATPIPASENRTVGSIAAALLQNMRPKQWAKNGFVFAAIVFDQQFLNADSMLRVIATFGLMCLAASSIYLINDLVDVERDRQHPKKRFRPIASGRLPVPVAIIATVALLTIAIVGGFLLDVSLALVVIGYVILHIAYSFFLKNIVILDVFAIAGGFVLRVIAGVVVIDVTQFSPWLYVCAALLSLFLAIGKRRQELLMMKEDAGKTRSILEEYNITLINDMLRLTITTTAIAYTLYATEAETILARADYMLLTVPFVYYALFRYMYVIYVKEHGGDPTELLFEDRPLQVGILLWIIVVMFLLYFA